MPASPRNVRFTEDPLGVRAQLQYRPRATGNPRGPGSRSTQQSLTQLDEATLDLLRLSSEPEGPATFASLKRVNPAADYLPKAASTSSVNKVIRTADGGRLRVANVYTWGVESDQEEVLDARNLTNGIADRSRARANGLSPQAVRRNEMQMRDGTVDEQEAYGMSPQPRRRSDTVGANYAMPSNGYAAESPIASPLAPRRQPAVVSPNMPHRQMQPPVAVARQPEQSLSPISARRTTETILDYEKRKQGPPVVRTTVEGKLRMEKIVGADLITVDSCVSSAWTVRDTVTNYKIKSTIGKKSLILEEVKDGQSKFKITLIENGVVKMEKEATLEIPEFMNKKDYLSEVGQRLLKDLREDADAVSAVTHVEVEVVEDVTNILKTYVIGERADDFLEEESLQAIHYEATADRTPSPVELKKIEKIYVDTLEIEEKIQETAEIRLLQEGHHFEGEGALKRVRRLETEDSIEVAPKVRCANAFADCNLTRREDSSNFTVHIAVPLLQAMSMILTRRRTEKRKEFSKAFAMEQAGQFFEEEASLRRERRVESAEEEEQHAVMVQEEFLQKAVATETKEVREAEAEGGSYEMEQEGLKLIGEAVIKRRGRAFDSESSEEMPPPKKIIMQEREAEGGQYEMEMQGVSLRGEKKFRCEGKRYESESEESVEWNAGSPTIVDLVKKESDSYFDVVFETANIYEPQMMNIKRAVMKKESCEVNSAFMIPCDDTEEVSVVRKHKSVWMESFSGRELSEQYAEVTVAMQKAVRADQQQMATEVNMAAVSRSRAHGRFREMREEQAMMLYGFENTKPARGEANVLRREKNYHGARFQTSAVEFEHITLNTGLSHTGEMLGVQGTSKTPNTVAASAKLKEMSLEHATSVIYLQKMLGVQDQFADGVAKDKHVREEYLKTRAASDNAVTSQYAIQRTASFPSMLSIQKNVATPNISSSAFRAWASESHAVSSTLMLSKGATVQTAATKIRDHHRQETTTHVAEYGQAQEHCAVMLKNTGGVHGSTATALAEAVTDLRIRRKDASSEVTVYFMYKQVLGNFAMAALGLYLGERIRSIREEHHTRDTLHTSEKLFEAHSRASEFTDEFERTEASRHLVTERSYTKGHVVIQLSDAEEFVAVGRFKSLMDECC